MNLNIEINGQILSRTDSTPIVADTKNYIHMVFNFINEEWNSVDKFAIFSAFNEIGAINRKVSIEDNRCLVPEDIVKRGTFTLTITGENDKGDSDSGNDVLITTTKLTFNVEGSGYIELSDTSEILNGNRIEQEDPKWQEILSSLE